MEVCERTSEIEDVEGVSRGKRANRGRRSLAIVIWKTNVTNVIFHTSYEELNLHPHDLAYCR